MMLNDEQQRVVDSIDPFIFLLAGAGSGKTRVIVEKIKKLMNEGVSPNDILAITFTRKASQEMKSRLDHNDLHIHTFHQLAYITLKEELKQTFEVATEDDLSSFTQEHILAVANYKNSMYKKKKPRIYDHYQKILKQKGLYDFDDLLINLYKALQRGMYRFSFRYIFIDEFQDTNILQYEVLKKMVRQHTHLFAVGDPDQSIYRFRGASPKIIDRYVKEFHATLYRLTYNYRSRKKILITANRIIKQNDRSYKKELAPTKQTMGLVESYRFKQDIEEASWIIRQIKTLINHHYKPNEIAILYRNHFRVYQLMLTCHQEGISFHIQDDEQHSDEQLQFLTIHQAKGLEFDCVFMIGCEDGLLPSRKINQKDSYEEERRLLFVAATRARDILCFTQIRFDAENHHFTSSPFIMESGVKTSNPKEISDIISLGDEDGHQKTHR